jgi:hypothetical protein
VFNLWIGLNDVPIIKPYIQFEIVPMSSNYSTFILYVLTNACPNEINQQIIDAIAETELKLNGSAFIKLNLFQPLCKAEYKKRHWIVPDHFFELVFVSCCSSLWTWQHPGLIYSFCWIINLSYHFPISIILNKWYTHFGVFPPFQSENLCWHLIIAPMFSIKRFQFRFSLLL